MKDPHQACPAWQEQSDRQLNLKFNTLLIILLVNGNASTTTHFHSNFWSAAFYHLSLITTTSLIWLLHCHCGLFTAHITTAKSATEDVQSKIFYLSHSGKWVSESQTHTCTHKNKPAAAATLAALPLHWNGLVGAAAGATPAATNGLVDWAAGKR